MQFSLFRMFLMTSAFAAVLSLANVTQVNMIGGVVAASGMGGLMLLVAKKDIPSIVYSVFFSGMGVLIGELVTPPVIPSGVSTDKERLYTLIVGAIAGGIAGCVVMRLDDCIRKRRIAREQANEAGLPLAPVDEGE